MQRIKNFGVGADIESIARFGRLDPDKDKIFLNKIFTEKELSYCYSNKNAASHLAARYAGKEAVIKALSGIGKLNMDYKKVEIVNNENKVPKVRINEDNCNNLEVHISLSHCEDKTVAFAIAMETENHG
ncbi:holo-ACP synthase [Candidatus Woesearchaeota archaeon]|nr:holo-ACP synthase [Candidatus Woesearchaeota archaeon]